MTFQLYEYLAFTKCRKVERIDISKQGFFLQAHLLFSCHKFRIQHVIKSEFCLYGSALQEEDMFGQVDITEIST